MSVTGWAWLAAGAVIAATLAGVYAATAWAAADHTQRDREAADE